MKTIRLIALPIVIGLILIGCRIAVSPPPVTLGPHDFPQMATANEYVYEDQKIVITKDKIYFFNVSIVGQHMGKMRVTRNYSLVRTSAADILFAVSSNDTVSLSLRIHYDYTYEDGGLRMTDRRDGTSKLFELHIKTPFKHAIH